MPGIVVGVDGSEHSRRALEWAAKEAAFRETPLTVLAVHAVAIGGFGINPIVYPEDEAAREKVRAAAQKLTDDVLAGGAKPPTVTVTAVNGVPAEELIKASQDADMVVVGSRGTGGFARLLIGSVSSQVAAHAHSPVVVIRHDGA
ncbi:MAG: universal stress protein [Streptosporangiaceae bacterium]|nr:universal stress protein [Streptosporangiaceae bacterium]MBV9857029.1 universal stress protein [Streptosporangiaceae bacterium]